MPNPRVKGSISNGTSRERDPNDFYETPRSFTRELLKRVTFNTEVWEPAAGKGAIADVLVKAGYNVVMSDILPRTPEVAQSDFLSQGNERKGVYDIITNPPFNLIVPFAEKAWELCNEKFALVLPISGLNSSKRYRAIWSVMPVSKIILSGRYQVVMSERGPIPSQFSHVWVVIDKGHTGPAIFEWTEDKVFKWSDS